MENAQIKFDTYAEALFFVKVQSRKYGRKAYTATPEYHALYPHLLELYKAENPQPRKRRKLKGADLRPMFMVAQAQGLI